MIKKFVFLGIALCVCSSVKPMKKSDAQRQIDDQRRRQEQDRITAAQRKVAEQTRSKQLSPLDAGKAKLKVDMAQSKHDIKYGRGK